MSITTGTSIELVPLDCDDAKIIYQLVEENRDFLARYLYWVDHVVNLESTKNYIQERVESNCNEAEWFKIKNNGRVCGIFGIKSISIKASLADIGYWLIPSEAGKGLMSKVVSRMICYLKEEKGVNSVQFLCLEDNEASRAVALKSGAKLVECQKNYLFLDGKHQDLHIFRTDKGAN